MDRERTSRDRRRLTKPLPEALSTAISAIYQIPIGRWRSLFTGTESRDAVEAAGLRQKVHKTANDKKSPAWQILNRLGHVPVNPNKPLNTAFLINSYAFADEVIDRPDTERFANKSNETTKDLLERLVECARQQNEILNSDNEILNSSGPFENDRIFFLTGGKGVGKTYFLNYILSKYSNYFDSRKVVWVRINLLTDRSFDGAISHRISAQISKILLRYYDSNSDFYKAKGATLPTDFGQHLSRWINETTTDPSRRRELHDAADAMKEAFYRRHKDEPISPELCPKLLCDELFAYAKRLGLGIIAVLDGYDRLEADLHQIERFTKNRKGIISLIENYELSGIVCVLCMRTVTYEFEMYYHPQFRSIRDNRYRVGAASFEAVLKKRFAAIVREIPRYHTYKSGQDLDDWIALVDKFEQELYKVSDEGELFIPTVSAAFGENNRTKMSAVKVEFQSYIATRTRQGYKIFEQLMRMGESYPPIYFEFRRGPEKLDFSVHDESDYDNRVLPVIFLPPYCRTASGVIDSRTPISAETTLLGVRLLQLISIFEIWLTEQVRKEPLYIHELTLGMREVFGYEREQVEACVTVLESFECIYIHNADLGTQSSSDAKISIRNKGRLIIEDGIRDVAVLNLSAMRVQIRPGNPRKFGVLSATAFDPSDSKSLRKWIRTKVANSLVLSALIEATNLEQERSFQLSRVTARIRCALQYRNLHSSLFDSLRTIRPAVLSEIASIISRGLDQGLIDRTDVESIAQRVDDIRLLICEQE